MIEAERLDHTLSVEACQQIIDELESVITDTRGLMARFEATGMDEAMEDDYFTLHELYTRSVKEQQRYTQILLDL